MGLPDNAAYNTFGDFLKLSEASKERMEYINGEIVYLAAPNQKHQDIAGGIYAEVRSYIRGNKGKCRPFIAPSDVQLGENQVQPDVFVVCDPEKLDGQKCIGAPDWVIEVTSSNNLTDYRKKFELYKKSGVREYWIVDPDLERVFVYFFEQNRNFIEVYDFTQQIPVNIYQDAPVQLSLCISELM